ncbi:MAG: PD40 domain-containing protein [Cytophagaceae bacterium]|nr:PD40 domain-containing protein [Cytophagaceae bacterium]
MPISRRPGFDKHPSWSPDGRYVAFISNTKL